MSTFIKLTKPLVTTNPVRHGELITYVWDLCGKDVSEWLSREHLMYVSSMQVITELIKKTADTLYISLTTHPVRGFQMM